MKSPALILLAFPLFLLSCSRMDIAWNYAPRYISNSLDDTFDLSSARYKKIKETVEQTMGQNKKELLSEVITKIDKLLELSEKSDLSQSELQSFFDSLRDLQKRGVQMFKPTFSELLLPLSKDEMSEMKDFAADKFKKSEERLSDDGTYKKYYRKSFDRYIDLFLDGANKDQEKLLNTFLEANHDYYSQQLEVRKQFLKQFEVLFNGNKKSELVDYTMKYYAGDPSVRTEQFRKRSDQFFASSGQLIYDMWKLSTDDQKSHLKKTLKTMRKDLSDLIK